MRAIKTFLIFASILAVGTFGVSRFRNFVSSDTGQNVEAISASDALHSSRSPASISTTMEVYTFERSIKALLHTSKGDRNFADLKYEGKFFLSWKDDHTAWISFEMKNPQMVSSVPFIVTLSKDGKIIDVKTVSSSNPNDQNELNILKDFASLYAFRSDTDTSGKYEANFSEEDGQIVKRKLRYVDSMVHELVVVKSESKITTDGILKIKTAEGIEVTHAKTGKHTEIRTSASFKIERQGSRRAETAANTLKKELVTTSLLITGKAKPQVLSWTELSSQLDSFRSLSRQERLSVFHELVKSLKDDPENLVKFQAWLMKHKNETGVLTFAIGVLATAGSAEAQHQLLQIFKDYPEQRQVVLNAFTTSNAKLSGEAREFLNSLIDAQALNAEQAYSASFALGSSIRQDPNAADISKLERLLNQATTTQEREYYLDAIGNSGNASFVSVIEKNLASTDDSVREKAVLALRLMKPEDSQNLVLQSWGDRSLKVKTAAGKVIGYQGASTVYRSLLQECAQASNAGDSALRTNCVRILSQK